jgi:tRNA (guanine37-N1)-methyltransferase
VDDKPYGGGPGMLMKTEPLVAAIGSLRQSLSTGPGQRVRSIYLSPQGRPLTQKLVSELAQEAALILVCGRYQGIDARVIESEIDEEVSLGDFVISGGEMAAMVLLDALIRLQAGALGDEDSALQDSFSEGLLHWPEYTRPANYGGQAVPDVLLSGDHQAIRRWREKQSLGVTWLKRPDLLNEIELNAEQEKLLAEFKQEYQTPRGE